MYEIQSQKREEEKNNQGGNEHLRLAFHMLGHAYNRTLAPRM